MTQYGRNYPENCWWVAARSKEITREPLLRWLLDIPVVFFRDQKGSPVALDNRCPHRWAPLSDGRLEGDAIVCPYHGAQFGTDGVCTKFPSLAKAPSNVKVRAYPLLEQGGFVWIWMGDDALCQSAPPPPVFPDDPDDGWFCVSGDYEFEANYFLLHENVLDLTHFNFVHAQSFGITSWNPDVKFEPVGDRVKMSSRMVPADFPSPEERAVLGMSHPDTFESIGEGWFQTPAWHSYNAVVNLTPQPLGPSSFTTNINHMVTPASSTHTYYWWYVETDAPLTDEIKAGYNDFLKVGYLEDKAILEAIQDILNKDMRGEKYPEFSFRGDAGGVLARRALERILTADQSGKAAG